MSHFGRSGPPDITDLVLNITFRTTADDLFPLFDKYGKVVDIFIPRDRRTGESKGFAFVRYKYAEEAQKAVDRLDGRVVDGREITVQFAKYGPNAERNHKGRIIETSPKSRYRSRSHSPRRRHRDDYKDKDDKDRDYKRRRSRSYDRYERDRYRGRDRDYCCQSRSRSASPDYYKSRGRGCYDDKHCSRSRSRSVDSPSPRRSPSPQRSLSPQRSISPRKSPRGESPENRSCDGRSPSPCSVSPRGQLNHSRSPPPRNSNGDMLDRYSAAFFLTLSWLVMGLNASAGDANPRYRDCVKQCEETGCVGQRCFPNCKFSGGGLLTDSPWYMQEPLYLQWKKWDCQSDCQYFCMLDIEKEKELHNADPVKYHGKWPFRRIYGMQEPASVAFSALNLAAHFHGWVSFLILLYYKMPLKEGKKVYYEYASLWHIYGMLSMNSWFWSAVFHSRDVNLTEKLDYSSAVALLGYSLILSILRSFDIRDEATRVMISAPLIAFVTTHILFINFYKLDYGWNMKVCVTMAVAQLIIWAVWAVMSRHPSRWKLWLVVVAGGLAMLLELYDFPPYKGLLDAHALWHATTIPLTYIWWSFIRDDAEFRTSNLMKKAR